MLHRFLRVLFISVTATLARADIIEVPRDFPTIQQAIDAAADGDEIVVSPGVYIENLSFLGKDLLIQGLDPGDPAVVAATVVDGDGAGAVVTMRWGELRGLTIRNGSAPIGGGVFARGNASVRFCNVTDNVASGQGGGIAALDRATIEHNRIVGNRAERGGGVLASSGAQILGNLIAGNFGLSEGGGIWGDAHDGLIASNTLLGNLGTLNASGMLVQDSMVTSNIVAFSPSGVVAIFSEGMADVDFNCVFGNAGGSFGGIGEFGDGNIEQDPELETVAVGVWTNDAFFDPLTFRTTFLDLNGTFKPAALVGMVLQPSSNDPLRYAVVANTSNTITVLGDAVGIAGSDDPYQVFDWHIGSASPCLDAADRNGPVSTLTGTDFDGEPRLMNCLPDIGADERMGTESNVLFVRSNSAVEIASSLTDCSGVRAFTGGANLFFDGTPTLTLTTESFNDVSFRWVVDGVEQAEGQASVELDLVGPVTAFAEYDLVTNITIGVVFDTIQDAVSSFSTADGDEIVVAPNVYIENVDFLGKDLFVHSTDPDNPGVVARTIIDGNQAASTVRLSAGEIRGFTIRNGDEQFGGGVHAEGTATVSQNVVERNIAHSFGAGISATDDSVVVGNVVRDNSSTQNGSGISVSRRATALDNLVENNIGADDRFEGGGIHARDSSVVRNNVVRGNQAGLGGGVFAQHDATISENLIIDNVGLNRAGGVFAQGGAVIERNWIQGNIALANGNGGTEQGGGGVYAFGTSTIQSNVIIGNDSIAPGGGLHLGFGTDAFANTIVDNTSNLGADGVFIDAIIEEFRVVNNIIAFNGERGIVADDPVFLDYNCVFGHTSQNYGGLAFPGDNDINVDPQLDTDRAHLLPNSPCIDAGVVGFRDPDGTDIDGDPRVINDRIDIGADETTGGNCPADLDGDGDADADDFFAYLDAFAGGNLAICDIDTDGDCDADDFFAYLDLFAAGC